MNKLQNYRKTLVIIAHPDDEVLGCGGTIAGLAKSGHEVYSLVLGEGVTSRDKVRNRRKRNREILQLREQCKKVNKILGVKEVLFFDFPDNRFDTVPFLDIVKVIEDVKSKIKPTVVFTHFRNDLNIDHQITYSAAITATRPLRDEVVREVYSFEVLSSTEWNYPLTFSPNVFFDISKTLDLKLEAIREYKTELKRLPHPRSLEVIKLNAKLWGTKVGLNYAEAFEVVRIIK